MKTVRAKLQTVSRNQFNGGLVMLAFRVDASIFIVFSWHTRIKLQGQKIEHRARNAIYWFKSDGGAQFQEGYKD